MRNERSIANASRRLSKTPYLLGERYSDTDQNHAFTAYWRMILGRNAPVVKTHFDMFSIPQYDTIHDGRPQAREAIKRLRSGWYTKVRTA